MLKTTSRPGPRASSTFVASQLEDVRRLRELRHRASGRLAVRLVVHGFDDSRRAGLERRLERHANACGCNEGTVAGLIYLAAVPILLVLGARAPSSPLAWLAVAGGFVSALLAGKVLGLALARWRFSRALREVERTFAHQAKGT